jgi:hypothetical protein
MLSEGWSSMRRVEWLALGGDEVETVLVKKVVRT